MNIDAKKLELMHLLLQTRKESVLTKLKKVFEEDQLDWWDEMSEEERKEVEIGLKEADEGKCKESDTIMKRFEKWR